MIYIENIDIEKLRADLIDYFSSAIFTGLSVAIIHLSDVELAQPDELIKIAEKNKFDLRKYKINIKNITK